MAVTLSTPVTQALNNGATTTTKSFTSTGLPMYVRVAWWTDTLSSVTYGGTALTRIAQSTAGSGGDQAEIWRLAAPTAGTANLVLTFASGQCAGTVAIVEASGLDPTTPEGTAKTAKSAANGTSIGAQSITGATTGDLTITVMSNGNGAAVTPTQSGGGGITEEFDLASNGERTEGSKITDAVTSTNASWTGSTSWAFAAIPLKAVVSSNQTVTPGFISAGSTVYAPTAALAGVMAPAFLTNTPTLYAPTILGGLSYTSTVVPYATLGPIVGASGGSSQGHLLFAKNTGRWWFITYSDIRFSGTATGGTNQTLVDSTKGFGSAGSVYGDQVVITSGAGAGQVFQVRNSNATTLRLMVNGDPATSYTLATAIASGSVYVVCDASHIKAYVSSSADLTSATWSLATTGTSPAMRNNDGWDMPGGRWDGGGTGGTYPADGRQWSVGYADISGHDVVQVIAQTGTHWFKQVIRGVITAATTMTWDNMAADTGTWDDRVGDQEALPFALQGLAIAFDSNNSRWHAIWNKTQGMAGSAWNVNDPGTGTSLTLSQGWTGYVQTNTYDSTTNNNGAPQHLPYQAVLAELASGIMLAVYTYGDSLGSGWSATKGLQTGLRYTKSSSGTAWPTTNVGAAVPSLSTASNSANDWGMVSRSTSDVHIVRRNAGTTLEHIRYDGTTWSSVTTLPTSGLTSHLAQSGVHLSTNGTDVYCFVLDTDANNSIKYVRWSGGTSTWDASWTTLTTNTNAKSFLTVGRAPSTGAQIGVAWTEGPDGSGRYQVMASSMVPTLSVAPSLITSSSVLYAPTLATGPVSVLPSFIASGAQVFAPSISVTGSVVSPPHLPSQAVIYAPNTASNFALRPALVASTATVFAVSVTAAFRLTPSLVAASSVVFAPTFVAGTATVTPALLTNAPVVYAPKLNAIVSPALLATGATVYGPSVFGAGTLAPQLIQSTASVFVPTFATGAGTLQPALVASSSVVYTPAFGGVAGPTLNPDIIPSAARVFAPLVSLVPRPKPPPLGPGGSVPVPPLQPLGRPSAPSLGVRARGGGPSLIPVP